MNFFRKIHYPTAVRVLMLLFVLLNTTTSAFAFESEMTTFVDRVILVFQILAALFVAYAGIRVMNGDGEMIKPVIIGLIFIFGSGMIVDFISQIFGN